MHISASRDLSRCNLKLPSDYLTSEEYNEKVGKSRMVWYDVLLKQGRNKIGGSGRHESEASDGEDQQDQGLPGSAEHAESEVSAGEKPEHQDYRLSWLRTEKAMWMGIR